MVAGCAAGGRISRGVITSGCFRFRSILRGFLRRMADPVSPGYERRFALRTRITRNDSATLSVI